MVGRPIPRLTRFPSLSSSATRLAITTLSSICPLPPFNQVVHHGKRSGNRVRRYDSDGNDMFRFGNYRVRRHSHHHVEVAGSKRVIKVAAIIGAMSSQQGEL